ncbi:restriction endonuclease subunit S [Pseudomonas chlororaphis]|uniref:Type I restriction-modification system, specificity subunit S n=1 Tax=Pseudomonas chlororaphis subsp. aureofaciens TaxID=587851 RepID=A0AAD0ZCN5_9PSED|nr:restriction endonuclease subunit S [Pseudomonas chlororaphis]AZE29231.1 Type I restriction-modification system, specificity subunit S [Pseudomonas chlororaphis subsp. aureofaciens]QTT89535.1 restriction endonuclease subunit S [Pseudomonas chlororaphis]
MQVSRQRYTPNDVGPSPLEWSAPQLSQVSELITNGFVGTASPFYTDESGVPYLYGSNVRPNRIDFKGIRYITHDFHEQESKTALKSGDLLMVQSGHIGETAVVPSNLEGANCHAIIVTRLKKDFVHPDYLSYYINSEIGRARLKGLEVGSTILHINTKDLKKFRVLLPSLLEQKKIARILSTWDQAIVTIEQLLESSLLQKKGLMQELLTGKLRLQGFHSDWRLIALGKLFKERVETGLNDLPLLSITTEEGVINRKDVGRKDTSNADKSKYLRICQNDIGYNTMRMWQGVSGISNQEGIVSPAYTVLIPQTGVDSLFASYLFKLPSLVHVFYRYSQGMVSDTWNLKYSNFAKIKWLVPNLDEQKAIVKVLLVADQEIQILRAKLTCLNQEKKSLMQQLLTGKRRVKVDELEAV